MKLIDTIRIQDCTSRAAELYQHSNNTFEVFCMIADQLSRAFPCKTFKTKSGAERYADKFLRA